MGITVPKETGDANKIHNLMIISALPPYDKFQSEKYFAGCKAEYGAENKK
jgi:hypothetical protein